VDFYLCEPVSPFHQAAGANFASFTTKQDISPVDLPVIPAGKLRKGSKLWVRAHGGYSSLTGAVLTLGFWFGTRTGTITGDLSLAGAFTTGTTPADWPFWLDWHGVCTATGPSGQLQGQGQIQFGSSLTAFNAEAPHPLTAALRTVTIDTTIERAIGVSGTWGASSASNIVHVIDHRVVILN
jgi:hypothetical protein